MALNIEDKEVERLATEVAHLVSETRVEPIRPALLERRNRLQAINNEPPPKQKNVRAYLAEHVWPHVPAGEVSREVEEQILGHSPNGY